MGKWREQAEHTLRQANYWQHRLDTARHYREDTPVKRMVQRNTDEMFASAKSMMEYSEGLR